MGNGYFRLDPNNPDHRKLIERSKDGKAVMQDYFRGKPNITIQTIPETMTEEPEIASSNKKNKYGNKAQTDLETGEKFDSKWEYNVYNRLRNLEQRGLISELITQAELPIVVEGQYICKLVVDYGFKYNDKYVYADAKSIATSPPAFKIKTKLLKAIYGIDIVIIQSGQDSFLDDIERSYYATKERKK